MENRKNDTSENASPSVATIGVNLAEILGDAETNRQGLVGVKSGIQWGGSGEGNISPEMAFW